MKILLLAPHADDVEFGCGGMITKLGEDKSNEFLWIVASDGGGNEKENLKAIEILELENVACQFFHYPGGSLLDNRAMLLKELFLIKDSFKPDLVIGPSLNDFHQDHQAMAYEMIRAYKKSCSILCYELPWNQVVFNTQMFAKLEKEHIEKKYKALMSYSSQILQRRKYFNKDCIFGLACVRGTQINADYAEAFEVVRWVL